ncbi:VPS10 [[Candida] subhashii]|uniref:VPS10 n=1 Tax=[Candida] subhashii TaxID=561895 RepID=A0A8J5QGB8_9ASCO|nr:VPS10 [[Candida] subhashii]KAG7660701.1 VPS10 [[Candida] subhashii]
MTAKGAFAPEVSMIKHRSPSKEIKYFDDSSNLLLLRDNTLSISFDDGKSFEVVKAIKDEVIYFEMDPYNNKRAFAMALSKSQYMTDDQGKTWKKYNVDLFDYNAEEMASIPKISFNAANSDYMMISNYHCPPGEKLSHRCKHKYFYTKDGFKTVEKLPIEAHICNFAKSTKSFKQGKDENIMCTTNKLNSYGHILESHLYKSDDFYKSQKELNPIDSATGAIIDIKVEESFIVVVSKMDKFNEKSRINIHISRDGENFERADLQVEVKYGVMSFLPSSPSSLFFQILDYASRKFQASTFYSSDSSGLHYKKLLEDVAGGNVQKVQNIDGAWIANIGVESQNSDDQDDKSFLDYLIGGTFKKDIVTKFSFNDGADWSLLKLNGDSDCDVEKGCSVHLWENSELDSSGKFVTGPTPGILLGVGNSGTKLTHDFSKMKTFVSRDGGATWDKAFDFPCVFSFGDQGNVILAVPYNSKKEFETSKKLHYSLDQGKSWESFELEHPIYPLVILTTVDGTSRKFVITGVDQIHKDQASEYVYSVDFSKAFDDKKCSDDDFEEFYARVTLDNAPICVYGHREKFMRRKQDAKCFVNKLFEDVKVIDDPCQCREWDFECAPGFQKSEKNELVCVPDPKQLTKLCIGKSQVKLPDKVLMAENKCDMGKKKLSDFVSEESIKCSDYVDEPGSGNGGSNKGDAHEVVVELTTFEGELAQYSYIDESKDFGADNVVLKTTSEYAYVSNNGGVSFTKIPVYERILGFFVGPIPGQLILATDTDIIYVSDDGGSTFVKQKAPRKPHPSVGRAVAWHSTQAHRFLWFGSDCADNDSMRDCSITAYLTEDSGESFVKLKENVQTCDFVGAVFDKPDNDLIFCSVEEDRRLALHSLTTKDKESKKLFDSTVGYAVTGNFVVVATVNEKKHALQAKVTVDGKVFADADFPHDFHADYQQAYTILDSKSKAIFIHVTTNADPNFEYGTILKSNSNGTSYVLSLENVNRNRVGYVDYDRIEGLEGVIIANVVSNANEKSGSKKLQSKISRNDGSEWNYLAPPAIDSKGKKYKCTGSPLNKCALHLHGFTERPDYRDTYSSGSATGFLIGVGSVGEHLEDYSKSSTFLSKDGGVTWKEVQDGVYMWEYGDRGTILVLVEATKATDKLLYSLDEGESWNEFKFADREVNILDLATVPTDTSRKFLILARDGGSATLSYSIDFTNIHKRQCQLNLDNPEKDDYTYWTPGDGCLFGHESKYLRRAIGHNDCFIGSAPLAEGFTVTRNCTCTRQDYECDYNYYRDDKDNTCKLVQGLTPQGRMKEMCNKENAFEYFESTGYRKIPLSTCYGGRQFDNWNPKACPGKEKEFNQHYGKEVTGHKLFAVVFVPLLIFIIATWFVYDRGIRRNGGFKRLGQIRLDLEDDGGFDPIENNQVDVVVNKIVRGGIFAAAVVIASVKTIIKIDKMLLERVSGFVFNRPGTRSYVNIPDFDDEEAELFGDFQDNIDDEIEEGARISEDFSRHDNPFQDEIGDVAEEASVEPEANNSNERLFDIDDEEEAPTPSR